MHTYISIYTHTTHERKHPFKRHFSFGTINLFYALLYTFKYNMKLHYVTMCTCTAR